MSTPTLPEDQLLELLTQLQKTTPDQARAILNAQPTIGYALVPLMARMGIVNLEILQKTLSTYAAPAAAAATAQPAPTPVPVPAVPPHLAQVQAPYGHHPTPPPASHTPVYPGQPAPTAYSAYPTQNGGYPPQFSQQYQQQQYSAQQPPPQQQQQQQQQQHWNGQQPPAATATAPGTAMLGALGNIPDDQREMIMRVIAMTPEQINHLPPQDRAITIQLRATLGLPTE